MIHEMMGEPGSLRFKGMGFDSISLILAAKKTFFGTFILLFLVHNSFKNLA